MNIIKTDEQFTVKGYAVAVEDNSQGYLSYPRTVGGVDAAMPANYVCITFHDDDGNECYLLQPGTHHEDCDVYRATVDSEGPYGDPDINPDEYTCHC